MTNWIKTHKLSSVLLIVVAFFIYRSFINSYLGIKPLSLSTKQSATYDSFGSVAPSMGVNSAGTGIALPNIMPSREYSPQTDTSSRLVIQESNLSLLVKDVVDTRNKILDYTDKNGGYMISASTSNPQDAPTSSISIRIPSDKLQDTLDYFHSLSIKVVSENLVGRDVTDQYVDIDKRISQLENSMARIQSILDEATKISDITSLTQQILSYQSQIDSYKGQQISLEKNAQLARLTIYLSTDEIALPYAPSETFRPQVIFKLAVRSLVGSLRGLAKAAIWIGVYAVIWIPALLLYVFLKKWWTKRQNAK